MVKAFLSIKVQLVTILLNWIPILGCFQTYNMSRRNLSQTIMSLSSDTNRNMAAEIMDRFSLRTGVLVDSSSGNIPESRRYLWTDSFALCNYLSLSEYASSTKDTRGENHFTTCAERIVKLVHQDLGRFKSDDKDIRRRNMTLSGLTETDASRHPTVGGLRIGKLLNERSKNEAYDEDLEWERDGQYFHYLTKWMFALNQFSRHKKDQMPKIWALELSSVATDAFCYQDEDGHNKMYWKMSTDLSYPLVRSMGAQDPVDGYTTLSTLLAPTVSDNIIDAQILEKVQCNRQRFHDMVHLSSTSDPLGIGGMMLDALRLLDCYCHGVEVDISLIETLLKQAVIGMRMITKRGMFSREANDRLAFRELGLSIGIHALEKMCLVMNSIDDEHGIKTLQKKDITDIKLLLQAFYKYFHHANDIEQYWCNPNHQHSRSWKHHLDINEVMLATSLCPDNFLNT